MRYRNLLGLLFLAPLIACQPMHINQEAGMTQPPAPSAPMQGGTADDANPEEIGRKMCDLLKSAERLSFKAEVTDDRVYAGGKKLQFASDITLYAQRPDRLRVESEGDLDDKDFFYDGRTITLYDQQENVYAVMDAPPEIEGALDKAHKEYSLTVALADLASPRIGEHLKNGLSDLLYVGLSRVRGVPCHHLSFVRGDVQFQIWIDAGKQPVPRKIVFTQKNLPGSPQWTAYLSDWNLSPNFPDGLFTFTPPPGAMKVKFVPVKSAAAP